MIWPLYVLTLRLWSALRPQDRQRARPGDLYARFRVWPPLLDSLDPKLPIMATVGFKVDGSKKGAFKSSVRALTEASKKAAGIKVSGFQRLPPNGREPETNGVVKYLLYQEWETVEQFRAQWSSKRLQDFMSAVFELIVAPPELNFYYDAQERIVMSQDPQTNPLEVLRANVNKMLDSRDPKAPISATVVFKVKKAKEKTFRKNADVLTEATRKLPGLKLFVYKKHQSFEGEEGGSPDAVEYLIYEDWETAGQFRTQWNSAHLRTFQEGVFELLSEVPPDLTFYEGWSKEEADDDDDGEAAAPLSKTGQKRCWNSQGELINCEGTGQDGDYQAGVEWPTPRFTDNHDGTVTDNLTALVWLKNANLFGEVMRDQALENAGKLASGTCGLSDGSKPGDWRLPNVNELDSLLDLNTSSGASIPAGHPFTNLQPANYWSSTSVAAFPALGWYVALAVGPPVFDLKFNLMRMWPVRGDKSRVARTGQTQCYAPFGQPIDCAGTGQDGERQAGVEWPDPRFTDNGDGTVTDNLTGLIWLKDGNPFGTRTWQQGLDDCNQLCSGNYGLTDGSKPGDWRMPNINELRSLEDYGEHTPAIAKGHPFTNVRQSLCWSSTTVASAPNLARFLFVGIGSCVWDHKSVLMGVWPVKGGR